MQELCKTHLNPNAFFRIIPVRNKIGGNERKILTLPGPNIDLGTSRTPGMPEPLHYGVVLTNLKNLLPFYMRVDGESRLIRLRLRDHPVPDSG